MWPYMRVTAAEISRCTSEYKYIGCSHVFSLSEGMNSVFNRGIKMDKVPWWKIHADSSNW